ncbi:EamA family transporter RarD [Desulfocurvus sp. DL9XJH121]
MPDSDPSPRTRGAASATLAFLLWGLLPVYWKCLGQVPALEILCHRIVWSLAFVALALAATRRFGELRAALASRRTVGILCLTSALVSVNWFTYIWAVNAGHVVEASLGYYINPLVNVVLGFMFLGERPGRVQVLAILLAAAGVSVQVLAHGQVPWIALLLAVSFGLYGLARKVVRVESLPGLFFETAALGLPAAIWLLHLGLTGQGALGSQGTGTDALLVGAGVVTALPLAAFAHAARRLSLVTVGVFQYMAPTCMFLLGVFVYREPFSQAHLMTFLLIWAGIAVYTADGYARLRRLRTAH